VSPAQRRCRCGAFAASFAAVSLSAQLLGLFFLLAGLLGVISVFLLLTRAIPVRNGRPAGWGWLWVWACPGAVPLELAAG
jgi:hypothetical protein